MPAFGPEFISPTITLLAQPITAPKGTTLLVPGKTGQRVYVYAYQLSAYEPPYVRFVDDASILTGAIVATAVAVSVPPPSFLFATAPGESLSISSTNRPKIDKDDGGDEAVTVFGTVSYWQE